MNENLMYRYWGKAKRKEDKEKYPEGPDYHLLVYHCLDVAAVAYEWWYASLALRKQFCGQTNLSETQTKAWLMFFIALHDLGKFDIRFQLKAADIWRQVNQNSGGHSHHFSRDDIKNYWHGTAGLYWLYQDDLDRFSDSGEDAWFQDEEGNESWQAWLSWMAPVAGHHGSIAVDSDKEKQEFNIVSGFQVATDLLSDLKQSRKQWLQKLEQLFLVPSGLSLQDDPPLLADGTLLAGFCSVSDWLGSDSEIGKFEFDDQPEENLEGWFTTRLPIARIQLQNAGVIGNQIQINADVMQLLEGFSPLQVQCLIPKLPKTQSLTLIEAATGSGKTEAALAHAWQLLEKNMADSIVFALPTQATANAMFERIEKAASVIFQGEINTVLAHGRARFHKDFIHIKNAVKPRTEQGEEEAWVQCAKWLADSKKRVFLGQIGICTVDQVLVSVLPVRHKFVRGFGIGRSVLIIDEVHAYDQYMYGLLEAVLKQQKAAGGSAILLSATLPQFQKQQLAKAWTPSIQVEQVSSPEQVAYPLITSVSENIAKPFVLEPEQCAKDSFVNVELQSLPELIPSDELLERMVAAAEQGAQVCLICNLVDVAQQSLQRLQQLAENRLSDDQLILFHSRFIFTDRQAKEEKVIQLFGPKGKRSKGHILVSTQVFECSIDADMDWMITQLCPVDLFFQRLGRLHRHQNVRPVGFEQPFCTVVVPEDESYQLHELIYGDSRILWRTQRLLENCEEKIVFPDAYRTWIEPVYQSEDNGDEPEWVIESHGKFEDQQLAQRSNARQLINSNISDLKDSDSNVSVLTRDGEMNLTLIPCYTDNQGRRCLLDSTVVLHLDDSNRFEKISLNSLGVPRSWNYFQNSHNCKNQLPEMDEDGYIWLDMELTEIGYQSYWQNNLYLYNEETGFQRIKNGAVI